MFERETEMSDFQWILFVILLFTLSAMIVIFFRRIYAGYQKIPRRGLIKVPMMKVFHNPFLEKPMWTLFNPATRTWEWFIDATHDEVEKYSGIEFTEEQGMKIISERKELD